MDRDRIKRILYTKYSNDRAQQFCIRTQIVEVGENKRRFLIKSSEYPSAQKHIEHIAAVGETLAGLYAESRFLINRCFLDADQVILEYIEGTTLEEELDTLLDRKQIDGVLQLIGEAATQIRTIKDQKEFEKSPEFVEVFGDAQLPGGLLAAPAANIDMLFSNILVNDNWNIIDYEWTFLFPIPTNYIVFRAIHYYIESAAKRWTVKIKNPYEQLGISTAEMIAYERMEQNFQKYTQGDHVALGTLYHAMGQAAIPISDILERIDERKLQVYFDRGDGFKESDSCFIESGTQGKFQAIVQLPKGVVRLRLDPSLKACMLEELKIAWDKDFVEQVKITTNGYELDKGTYLFQTTDPNITITDSFKDRKVLYIEYRLNLLNVETVEYLIHKLKNKTRNQPAEQIPKDTTPQNVSILKESNDQKSEQKPENATQDASAKNSIFRSKRGNRKKTQKK
ncbi:hypothetical protein LQZ18_04535 [Lachnospiraceae bacterium ZAX-1]